MGCALVAFSSADRSSEAHACAHGSCAWAREMCVGHVRTRLDGDLGDAVSAGRCRSGCFGLARTLLMTTTAVCVRREVVREACRRVEVVRRAARVTREESEDIVSMCIPEGATPPGSRSLVALGVLSVYTWRRSSDGGHRVAAGCVGASAAARGLATASHACAALGDGQAATQPRGGAFVLAWPSQIALASRKSHSASFAGLAAGVAGTAYGRLAHAERFGIRCGDVPHTSRYLLPSAGGSAYARGSWRGFKPPACACVAHPGCS